MCDPAKQSLAVESLPQQKAHRIRKLKGTSKHVFDKRKWAKILGKKDLEYQSIDANTKKKCKE